MLTRKLPNGIEQSSLGEICSLVQEEGESWPQTVANNCAANRTRLFIEILQVAMTLNYDTFVFVNLRNGMIKRNKGAASSCCLRHAYTILSWSQNASFLMYGAAQTRQHLFIDLLTSLCLHFESFQFHRVDVKKRLIYLSARFFFRESFLSSQITVKSSQFITKLRHWVFLFANEGCNNAVSFLSDLVRLFLYSRFHIQFCFNHF
jgi:hypothetical protein